MGDIVLGKQKRSCLDFFKTQKELGHYPCIKHYLLRYDAFNRYRYIDVYDKPIITWDLGSNYFLDEKLIEEIRENGLELNKILKNAYAL